MDFKIGWFKNDRKTQGLVIRINEETGDIITFDPSVGIPEIDKIKTSRLLDYKANSVVFFWGLIVMIDKERWEKELIFFISELKEK